VVAHAGISLFFITFKHECVHLRFNKIDRFVASEVIFGLSPEILYLSLDLIDFSINLFKIRAELRVNNVVILFSFADINTLFKHLTQLSEVFEGSLQLIKDLGAQRVVLIHHMLVQVPTQLLQSEYHIVNFHTVNQLSIISQFGLYSIEFCIEFFKIWELNKSLVVLTYSFEMNSLDVFSNVVI